MSILRMFWNIAAFMLTVLLFAKLLLGALVLGPVEVLPTAFGILFFFYILFALEGNQVAGIQIKDLEVDAVENHLRENGGVSNKVMPAHKTFSTNFDGFVIGRQIFTIMTVVAISFLINSLPIPLAAVLNKFTGLQGFPPTESALDFINGGLFAFLSATLVPAWWCQLLSQFLADGRAIKFLSLPGTSTVVSIAMLLDKLQLGQPARAVYRLLTRKLGGRNVIPMGRSAYYNTSLNFYGRAKKQHRIKYSLGKSAKVQEEIDFVFKGGKTEYIDHKIQLSAPIVDDLDIRLKLPHNVFGDVVANHSSTDGVYVYNIQVRLNQPLPRENVESEEASLMLEYQTSAYTDKVGVPYTTEFSSSLPTARAILSIQGGERLIKEPKVRVVEPIEGGFRTQIHGEDKWSIMTSESGENQAEIEIPHPTVATVYQVEFETMDVDLDNRP